jgi:hypothetical protein
MGQGGEGKAAVGETHPFGIVAENPVGGLDDVALTLAYGLPAGFLDTLVQNEPVDLRHVVSFAALPQDDNFYPKFKCGGCSRKLFEDYLILIIRLSE